MPQIDWKNGKANGGFNQFLEVCNERFFEQLIEFPTHRRGNILDLLLTDMPERFIDISGMGMLGSSDHVMIMATLSVAKDKPKTTETVPDWRKADWAGLKGWLTAAALPNKMATLPAEECWGLLRDTVLRAVNMHVPVRPRRNPNKPPWMTKHILRAIRKKKRVWRKDGAGHRSQEYLEIEKKVKNLVRNAKRAYERRLARDTGKNSKPFYAYLKGKTKNRVPVGPLKVGGGPP